MVASSGLVAGSLDTVETTKSELTGNEPIRESPSSKKRKRRRKLGTMNEESNNSKSEHNDSHGSSTATKNVGSPTSVFDIQHGALDMGREAYGEGNVDRESEIFGNDDDRAGNDLVDRFTVIPVINTMVVPDSPAAPPAPLSTRHSIATTTVDATHTSGETGFVHGTAADSTPSSIARVHKRRLEDRFQQYRLHSSSSSSSLSMLPSSSLLEPGIVGASAAQTAQQPLYPSQNESGLEKEQQQHNGDLEAQLKCVEAPPIKVEKNQQRSNRTSRKPADDTVAAKDSIEASPYLLPSVVDTIASLGAVATSTPTKQRSPARASSLSVTSSSVTTSPPRVLDL